MSRDHDVVMSFENGEVTALTINQLDKGYKKVTSKIWDEENRKYKTKNHYIHRMKAELYGAYRYGSAKIKPLEELECHHMNGIDQNGAESTEWISHNAHDKFWPKGKKVGKRIPGFYADKEEQLGYMQQIEQIAREEEPDRNTFITSGVGLVNGQEVYNLPKIAYADDVPEVKDIMDKAWKMVQPVINQVMTPVEKQISRDGYTLTYGSTIETDAVMKDIEDDIFEVIKASDRRMPMQPNIRYRFDNWEAEDKSGNRIKVVFEVQKQFE